MEIRQRSPQVWIIKCLKRETKLKDIIKKFPEVKKTWICRSKDISWWGYWLSRLKIYVCVCARARVCVITAKKKKRKNSSHLKKKKYAVGLSLYTEVNAKRERNCIQTWTFRGDMRTENFISNQKNIFKHARIQGT